MSLAHIPQLTMNLTGVYTRIQFVIKKLGVAYRMRLSSCKCMLENQLPFVFHNGGAATATKGSVELLNLNVARIVIFFYRKFVYAKIIQGTCMPKSTQ